MNQNNSRVDDLFFASDLNERAKVVECTYNGQCNMYYYNKDDFCNMCHFNKKNGDNDTANMSKKKNKNKNSKDNKDTKVSPPVKRGKDKKNEQH